MVIADGEPLDGSGCGHILDLCTAVDEIVKVVRHDKVKMSQHLRDWPRVQVAGAFDSIGDNLFGIGPLTARIARLEAQVRTQGETINTMAQLLGIDLIAIDPMGQVDEEESNLVRAGKTIQAIKHHRERTGSSLLEAKTAVDRALGS